MAANSGMASKDPSRWYFFSLGRYHPKLQLSKISTFLNLNAFTSSFFENGSISFTSGGSREENLFRYDSMSEKDMNNCLMGFETSCSREPYFYWI